MPATLSRRFLTASGFLLPAAVLISALACLEAYKRSSVPFQAGRRQSGYSYRQVTGIRLLDENVFREGSYRHVTNLKSKGEIPISKDRKKFFSFFFIHKSNSPLRVDLARSMLLVRSTPNEVGIFPQGEFEIFVIRDGQLCKVNQEQGNLTFSLPCAKDDESTFALANWANVKKSAFEPAAKTEDALYTTLVKSLVSRIEAYWSRFETSVMIQNLLWIVLGAYVFVLILFLIGRKFLKPLLTMWCTGLGPLSDEG